MEKKQVLEKRKPAERKDEEVKRRKLTKQVTDDRSLLEGQKSISSKIHVVEASTSYNIGNVSTQHDDGHKCSSESGHSEEVEGPANKRAKEGDSNDGANTSSGSEQKPSQSNTLSFGVFTIKNKHLAAHVDTPGNGIIALRHITCIAETCHLGELDAPVLNKDVTIDEPVGHSVFVIAHNMNTMDIHNSPEAPHINLHLPCCLRLCPEARLCKEIYATILTVCDPQNLIKDFGSIDAGRILTNEPVETLKAVYHIQDVNEPLSRNRRFFSKDTVILPLWKMINHRIPNPLTRPANMIVNQVMNIGKNSQMFALDIETIHSPTRVGLVNEAGITDYDRMIHIEGRKKEKKKLTDRFGDFTEKKFEEKVTIPVARQEMGQYIGPSGIIVGLQIDSDLNGLELMHPYIVELHDLFNLDGRRYTNHGLNSLAEACLWFDRPDHYPAKDALVTMKLIKQKINSGVTYKNEFLMSRSKNILSQGFGCIVGPENYRTLYENVDKFFVRNKSTKIEFYGADSSSNAVSIACEHLEQTITAVHLVDNLTVPDLDTYVEEIWNSAHGGTVVYVVLPKSFMEVGRVFIGVKPGTEKEKEDILKKKENITKERERLDKRSLLEVCHDNMKEQCKTS